MKNCLIFGSGRSGTSMLGGMLHDSGYYMGEDLYPARDSNPKGFFENDFINGINEKILIRYDSNKHKLKGLFTGKTSIYSPGKGQHWLSCISEGTNVDQGSSAVVASIKKACSESRFAYKDPRFSYTLPVWEKYLPEDAVYVVIFRNPSIVVSSIIKECAAIGYLKNMMINPEDAYSTWISMYSHILKNYDKSPEKFFFVNYDNILNGGKIDKLSEFLSVTIRDDFIDHKLRRSNDDTEMPEQARKLYDYLNAIADKA